MTKNRFALALVVLFAFATVGCWDDGKKEACWPLCDVGTSPTPTLPNYVLDLQVGLCMGGSGPLCVSPAILADGGTTRVDQSPRKVWAIVTHAATSGCSLDVTISASATSPNTDWVLGPAGHEAAPDLTRAVNPFMVGIVVVPGTLGSARVVTSVRQACSGQVKNAYSTVTLSR